MELTILRKITVFFSFLTVPILFVITSTVYASPFQEELASHPLKVVVLLDYTYSKDFKSMDKIAVSYEDGDGYKEIKYYDFDKMMKRDPTEPVKVKAKFPRDTVACCLL